MSTGLPIISIIVPVFNRDTLISESLDSILNQSFSNWECIIVDDHSTDDTSSVIQKYVNSDKRFKYFVRPSHKPKGANSCRNYGLQRASGEFIQWFDSDDIAHPECLKTILDLLRRHDVDFCRFSRSTFRGDFDYDLFAPKISIEEVEYIDCSAVERLLKNELSFNTCNVIWKRSSLRGEEFNEGLVYADEWEYYSRLLSEGLVGISVETVLFYGRKHQFSTTYEFYQKDHVRRASKVKAVKLVIENLQSKKLLSSTLTKYFLRTGFFLKERSIIYSALENSEFSVYNKMKFKLGFEFYPLLKVFFRFKSKLR